jgi:hypothetical protein
VSGIDSGNNYSDTVREAWEDAGCPTWEELAEEMSPEERAMFDQQFGTPEQW